MRKIVIQIFMAIVFAIPVIGQTVHLQNVTGAVPGPVSVDVSMLGFTGSSGSVGAITLFIEYDKNLLAYSGPTSVPFNGANIIVAPDYAVNTMAISWFNTSGIDINGLLIALQFNYSGGFASNLTFKSGCEIGDDEGNTIIDLTNNPGSFNNGSITPNLTDPDGIASLGTVSANVGQDVLVPMSLLDNGGFNGIASSFFFKVAYDIEKLSYLGVIDNVLGLTVGVSNGVISLSAISSTPGVFPLPDPIIKLNFTYLGGGTTEVEFQPGSIVTDNSGVVLNTKFLDGAVQLTAPTAGTLTIAKVSSPDATYTLPGPTPQDTLWTPAVVTVPITALGITELAGVIDLKIAFDNTRLTYSGYTANQFTGWVVTSNQSLGTLSFTKTSATALTIANGAVLTLNFDYLHGVADITFEPGTILQKIDATPIPVGLVDGYVTDFITVNAKVYLQGAWNVTNGNMNTTLLTNGVIPLAHPYSGAPWNYTGTESVSSIPANVVDWVLVDLRTGTAAGTKVGQRAGFLLNDGRIVDLDGTSLLKFTGGLLACDNYYIVVRHRNHLAIMSATAQLIDAYSLLYDFTDNLTKAFNNGISSFDPLATLAVGIFGMWGGDVNANGNSRYNGPANDRSVIFNVIANAVVPGYLNVDVNMNAIARYNGPANDRSSIFNFVGNNVIVTHVP